MKLSEKHLKIVELLLNDSMSLEKLTFTLEVSEKTILNYIKQINHYFDNLIVISKYNRTITLYIKQEQKFFNQFETLVRSTEESNCSNYNAMVDIFFQILKNDPITIDEIAEYHFMSKTSVNNLLSSLKEEIEEYNVSVIGKPNVGLSIGGVEYDIRKLIIEKFIHRYDNTEIDHELFTHLNKLRETLKLDEQSYTRFIVSIMVTIERIGESAFIDNDISLDNHIFSSNDYKEIVFIRDYLNKNYRNIDVDKEMILIVIQLMGRRASILDELISSTDEALINRVISNTIDEVIESFAIEIDYSLFTKDIRLHIKHLINRMLFDIRLNNEISYDMKQRFPFAYELSKVLGENITKEIGLDVSEQELGFLTIYFSIYLEQLEQELNEISNIAILTDYGLSTIKLLKNNLYKVFGENISITTMEKVEFNERVVNDYELIISTTKENRLFNRVIYIEDAFDEQLLKLKVEQFLIYKDLKSKTIFNKSVIVDCMSDTDLHHIKDLLTYEEVIRQMVDILYHESKVEETFKAHIIEREKRKSTVNKRLGFPHASQNQEGIYIKVAILEKGSIDYPDLKIVVLIATPEKVVNEALLIRTYEEVLNLSTNAFLINKFSQKTTFADFAQVLNQEMRD
ncbi:PRD domain-containing protein [Staphylococcus equorum]|uniref:PRD domain-containing protein n=1 Tax=Staphylococcus equorum TaxID=246432 RepID=A0A9X4LDN5_9STAP|nr:PRD domain-containing protein [Staphylococcus equorum]MDG0844377.1 PRD domain-containing protein [Staphylococcus equorum]MDG0860642.1 PRD domain-containing protein [Staphylococcus equorum]